VRSELPGLQLGAGGADVAEVVDCVAGTLLPVSYCVFGRNYLPGKSRTTSLKGLAFRGGPDLLS
jgi:hypothetical protein